MNDVTRILSAVEDGDAKAADRLLPLVYQELRKLAAAKLAKEKPGQTLQSTVLVHEAYLRLVDVDKPQDWNGRGHFFAAAAEAMRRILVENARRKSRLRHGGGRQREALGDIADPESDKRLLALDDALIRLEAHDAIAAQVVKLRHFCGMGHKDVATALSITVYQARQKWTFARAWLRSEIREST